MNILADAPTAADLADELARAGTGDPSLVWFLRGLSGAVEAAPPACAGSPRLHSAFLWALGRREEAAHVARCAWSGSPVRPEEALFYLGVAASDESTGLDRFLPGPEWKVRGALARVEGLLATGDSCRARELVDEALSAVAATIPPTRSPASECPALPWREIGGDLVLALLSSGRVPEAIDFGKRVGASVVGVLPSVCLVAAGAEASWATSELWDHFAASDVFVAQRECLALLACLRGAGLVGCDPWRTFATELAASVVGRSVAGGARMSPLWAPVYGGVCDIMRGDLEAGRASICRVADRVDQSPGALRRAIGEPLVLPGLLLCGRVSTWSLAVEVLAVGLRDRALSDMFYSAQWLVSGRHDLLSRAFAALQSDTLRQSLREAVGLAVMSLIVPDRWGRLLGSPTLRWSVAEQAGDAMRPTGSSGRPFVRRRGRGSQA